MQPKHTITYPLTLILLLSTTTLTLAFITDSTPPPTPLLQTWYVGGSGPGNYTNIQAAIDNASYGDTIIVYTGFYHQSLRITKTLTLLGIDHPELYSTGNTTLTILADNCILTNFSLNGENNYNAINCTSDGNVINHCTFHYATIDLNLKDSSNNVITDNDFSGGKHGIYLTHSSDNIISNNTISNHFYGQMRLREGSHRNQIIHNDLSYSTIYEGIINDDCSYTQIINNTIAANNYGGILVSGGHYLTIVNNTFIYNGLEFDVPTSIIEHYAVHGNTINGRPLYVGINQQDFNVPVDAGQIQLYNCTNVRIQNCTPTETAPGIIIENCSQISITRTSLIYSGHSDQPWVAFDVDDTDTLIIINNSFAYAYYMMSLGRCTHVIVANNTLRDIEENGISVWYCPGAIIEGNILVNVSRAAIDGVYSDACRIGNNTIYASGNGISLSRVKGCTITSNYIEGSIRTGIGCYTSRRTTISDNSVCNSHYGIYLEDSALIKVTGNNLMNNTINGRFLNSLACSWSRNYWSRYLGFGPKIVLGTFEYVIEPDVSHSPPVYIIIPVIRLDKFPAHTPYPYVK